MPSMKSRLFYFMIRYGHLLRGQLRRQSWDENTSIPAFREQCERGAGRLAKLPPEVQIQPVEIPGLAPDLKAEWHLPPGSNQEQVIFFVHGGGYISGSCSDHRALVAKLALQSGLRTLLFEYRLAPEHPFPAAFEDTLAAYRWLLELGYLPENIAFVGESAGGGLLLSALLALRDQGLPLPCAAVAMSPSTDLTMSSESQRRNVNVCISPPGMPQICVKSYLGENDPRDPYISPLFGDLAGLPPLLLFVGDTETLLDDSTRFAAKAAAAGVQVTLRVGKGMVHCYPVLAPMFPEATEAMEELCDFLKAHLGQRVELQKAGY